MATSQFVGKSKASTIERVTSSTTGTINPPQSTVNWNSASIGTAADDRRVFVGLEGLTHPLASATIGGITAKVHSTITGTNGGTIFSAEVPTGTTANIVMNFTVGAAAQNFRATTFRATGITDDTHIAIINSTGTNGNPSFNINGETGGILVGTWTWNGLAGSLSFSGIDNAISAQYADLWKEVSAGGTQNFSASFSSPLQWRCKVLSFI